MTEATVNERRDLLKRALLRMQQLEAEVAALRAGRAEPLAIAGMGCRFPGGADDPARFAELLARGFDATCEIPADRWDVDAYYDPDARRPGSMYVRRGAFLTCPVDRFDPGFFGIAPREADELDPQQRLLLEVTWETLERAGLSPASLHGRRVGIFVGMAAHDWSRLQAGGGDTRGIGTYYGTGTAHSVAAGRIAYLLGVHGPAITVDTACSSSLVAFHLACQALRNGEVDAALAGGVSLILAPDGHVIASRGRMLSPRGRCSTFDATADGYVRGEGCGMVLLERAADARAAGHPVLALVRGSALNQDGRSGGITAPNGRAQEDVMRAALAAAGVSAADVAYIEAHGTGTELGDPIEVHALAALHAERPAERPLLIGSVKTNIGHLEAAAGIAGVIKTVLALRAEHIPPHLHFHTPNPHIDWDAAPIRVAAAPTRWPQGRQVAGVSSFGFSGTNAHVILEATSAPPASGAPPALPVIVPLSARTDQALRALAGAIAAHASDARADVGAIARTLARGRTHWEERAAVVAGDGAMLEHALRLLANDRGAESAASRPYYRGQAATQPPRVAFLFTGQGSQRPGMGRELLASEPVFRAAVQQCDELLAPRLGLSIRRLLETDEPAAAETLRHTRITQPALFVLEYGLAALWRSWGVEPTVVLGHSVGEYVAACCAGVFSLEHALELIAERARLMGELPAGGSMATVFAGAETVEPALAPYAGRVSVAAINGPNHTVISGDATALAALLTDLERAGIASRSLHVSHAFHSPRMEPMLSEFRRIACGIPHATQRIDIIANLTGTRALPHTLDAEYWARHISEPVQFQRSIEAARAEGVTVLLELGPAPVLLGLAAGCPGAAAGELRTPSLRPAHDAVSSMREALAQLYCAGVTIDWDRVYAGPLAPCELPTYPFQRERHWFTPHSTDGNHAASRQADGVPELLGRKLETPRLSGCVCESQLEPDAPAWLSEHQVLGQVLLPAAAMLELCRAALHAAAGRDSTPVDVQIHEPLVIDRPRTLQTIVDTGAGTIEIVSRAAGGEWQTHVQARIAIDAEQAEQLEQPSARLEEPAALPEALETRLEVAASPEAGVEVDVAAYYEQLEAAGVSYGPRFRGLRQARRGPGWAAGELAPDLAAQLDAPPYALHPALLDAAFQLCGLCIEGSSAVYLPVGAERVTFGSAAASTGSAASALRAAVVLRDGHAGSRQLICDVRVHTPRGHYCIEGLRFQAVAGSRAAERRATGWLYRWNWAELPALRPGAQACRWRVIGTGADADAVAAALARHGASVSTLANALPAAPGAPGSTVNGNAAHGDATRGTAAHDSTADGTVLVIPRAAWEPGVDVLEALRPALSGLLAVAQQEQSAGRLCVLTRGAFAIDPDEATDPAASAVWGMGQTIAAELPLTGCRRIDTALAETPEAAAEAAIAALLADTEEDRLAWRRGRWFGARLERYEPGARLSIPEGDYCLETRHRGELDALVLTPQRLQPPAAGELSIRVQATGLNFRDVLNALGMYPGDAGPLGSECVGTVEQVGAGVTEFAPGERVLAITPRGFCSRVNVPASMVVRCPAALDDAAAATIPIAFLTADWALHELAQLQPGERVLVHAAAGGVGLAAVQLAQAAGAEVFATAGSEHKRNVLRRLGVRHIYDSRTLDFRAAVLADTAGQGVHVVLNSLAGEFIPATLDVLAERGRFVEIGRTDVWDEAAVRAVRPDARYHVLYLGDVCVREPQRVHARFEQLMQRIGQGALRPLPVRRFSVTEAVSAFRYMAQARHMGKIVLLADESDVFAASGGAAWITGGLGGLGLAAAGELVARGCRRIALTGRHEPGAAAVREIAALADAGAEVRVLTGDVACRADVERMRDQLLAEGWSIRTIIHAAGVLADAALPNQSWERCAEVLGSKAAGAWHLHEATRELPVEQFVLYSAGAAWLGSPGQANYAAANAFLDGLVQLRRSAGLPATAIAWGPWAEVGMAARSGRDWSASGLGSIDAAAGAAALRRIVSDDLDLVAVLPIDWRRFPAHHATGEPRRFFALLDRDAAVNAVTADTPPRPDPAKLAALPAAERLEQLIGYLQAALASVLGLRAGTLPANAEITRLGFDSLMAMELRNRIQSELQVLVPVSTLLDCATVQTLAAELDRLLGGREGEAPVAAALATLGSWEEGEL